MTSATLFPDSVLRTLRTTARREGPVGRGGAPASVDGGPTARAGLAPPGPAAELRCRSSSPALTRPDGPSVYVGAHDFDWSANPYRVGEVGSGSGAARTTHAGLGHADPGASEDRVHAHRGFAAALRRELGTRVAPGEHVAFGTATEPYPPAERREGIMRAALREVARASGLRVSITTQSTLVARDIDLLVAVAARNAVQVNLTITTPDARLAKFLEPLAPSPAARIETLGALRAAGLRAGVFLMPVLPGVTDVETDLRSLLVSAADAGASFVAHRTIVLQGPARAHFLARLRRVYPRVAARYEVWARIGPPLPADVRVDVSERVRRVAALAGLAASTCEFPPRPAAGAAAPFPGPDAADASVPGQPGGLAWTSGSHPSARDRWEPERRRGPPDLRAARTSAASVVQRELPFASPAPPSPAPSTG